MQDKKWWFVFILSLLSVGSNFWGFPIYILDEARNSSCAMEMMQRGDWIVPTFNDMLRTDKPPLHYFFMIASYHAFGVSPFSARFFSIVMGLLTIGLVYFSVKSLRNERTAFYSSLILVSSVFFVIQFHLAVPDPYLIFFLTASWLSFLYGYQKKRDIFFYLSYASAALAFMSKGPVAVALTGIVFVLFLIERRELSLASWVRLRMLTGMVIFLAITLPWWVAVTLATDGAWPKGFIWEHNVGRYFSPMEGHGAFPGFAIILFFVALLPLSFYLPAAMRMAWSERKLDVLSFFSLIVSLTVILFFSFSKTILPNYIAPAVPFGAIVLGSFIDRRIDDPFFVNGVRKAGSIIVFIMALAAPFVLKDVVAKDRWLSDLTELRWILLPVSADTLGALYFIYQKKWRESILCYLFSFWLVSVLTFYWAAPAILSRNPVTESLSTIDAATGEIVAYGNFNPAYVFALKKPLLTFTSIDKLATYCENKSVTLISRKEYETQLQAIGFQSVFEKPYLFEYPIVLVMTRHP